ncbi:hypothetical protein A3Q56_00300 [Intoshia linei]|uniref:HAT C-terminal dimerisation domain-containing protein n=1 Tax=Intoshia linei TaxID=1819745 RepID=A0A177BED8_9BILA|nr:hypothetical protein A3Q56_00300 [Intoshia linei]
MHKKLLDSWLKDLPEVVDSDTIDKLKEIWSYRWNIITTSNLGKILFHLLFFFSIYQDRLTSNKSTEYCFKGWAHKILPESKITMFEEEFNEILNSNTFEMKIDIDCFPIHTILKNVLMKLTVSEAAVERCFSQHRNIYSNVRNSLFESTLNDSLYIRYNWKHIL